MTTQIENPPTPVSSQLPITTPQLPPSPAPSNSELCTPNSAFPLLPRARFTLLLGDPGTGKSLLATHLAARSSLRSPLPPHPFQPNPLPWDSDPDSSDLPPLSIICSKEDDDDTLRFRLSVAAHGTPADTRFIQYHRTFSLVPSIPARNACDDPYSEEPEALLSPLLATLHRLAAEHQRLGLLVLDPLPAFLENIDATHNPALIRRALTPLLNFAFAHDLTVLGITHLAKSHHPKGPLFQAASSYAYVALARSVLYLTHDTLTHNPMRRLLIPIKNTYLLPTCAYSLTFHSASVEDVNIPLPYLTFDPDPIPHHPLLPTSPAREQPISDSMLELAEHFLRATLLDGPLPSARLLAEAHSLGISTGTFLRARSSLHTQHFRHNKIWFTQLPSATPDYAI